jgi:Zn-dependent protease with chaperone function
MIIVLSLAAALWAIGWANGASRNTRAAMVAVLMVAVIVVHLILPDEHPIRQNTGHEAALWIFIIVAGFIIWGYSSLLSRMRSRVQDGEDRAAQPPPHSGPFSDT